jgi:hypothetical protein
MTSQNPTNPDVKILTVAQDDEAQADVAQPEVKNELTDEEIASVAGGNTGTSGGLVTGTGFKSGKGTYYP